MTGTALIVETSRDRNRVRVGFDHCVKRRIQLLNAVEVTQDQVSARKLAVGHGGLELWDRRFNKRKAASAKRSLFEQWGEPAGQQRRAACGGRSEKASP